MRLTIYHRILAILLLAAVTLIAGCVNDPVPVPEKEKKFELGEKTEFLTLDIGDAHVILTVDTGKYKGFGLYALDGAYSPKQTIHISATPITSNTFGDDVAPITPLFTFDAGGRFATANIIITIPVTIPNDKFAMGFYYDPITHELEGLPLDGENSKSISVVLRKPGDFFISMISKSKLGGGHTSSFHPELDNWDIVNEGTVLTPSGQFAGQTLSALWYYYKKASTGNPHLRDKYNSTLDIPPTTWYDNVEGILFASQTELDFNWTNKSRNILDGIYNGTTDVTQNLVAYSILVTKKPQCVALVNAKAVSLPVIVHKIDNQLIQFSDPNFPYKSVTMSVAPGGNAIYGTALSQPSFRDKKYIQFTNCVYLGASAIIDFDKISKSADSAAVQAPSPKYISTVDVSYPGFLVEKIGDRNFTLSDSLQASPKNGEEVVIIRNGKVTPISSNGMYPLTNGENLFGFCTKTKGVGSDSTVWKAWSWYKVTKQSFVLLLPIRDTGYIGDQLIFVAETPYPAGSNLLYEWDAGDGRPTIKTSSDTLKVSYDRIGTFSVKVTITDLKTGTKNTSESTSAFVGSYPFTIFAVNRTANSALPTTFFTESKHTSALHLRYEWDFGDGSGTQFFIDSNLIGHSYKSSGKFTVKFRTHIISSGQLYGTASIDVNIQNPLAVDLSVLKSMKFVKVGYYGIFTKDHSFGGPEKAFSSLLFTQGSSSDTASNRIIWNGNSFTASFSSSSSGYDQLGSGSSQSEGAFIRGELSSDGRQLVNIDAGYSYKYSSKQVTPGFPTSTTNKENISSIGSTTIPASSLSQDSIVFFANGPLLQFLIKTIASHSLDQSDVSGSHQYRTIDYITTDWSSVTEPPRLIVTFYK